MSSAAEISEAFNRVDALLACVADTAPAIALLQRTAVEQGLTEQALATSLRANPTVLRWMLRIGTDATTDRSIDLDGDVGELLLRWVRA